MNRYAYVLNNPVKYIDPTGHRPLCYAYSESECNTGGLDGTGGGQQEETYAPLPDNDPEEEYDPMLDPIWRAWNLLQKAGEAYQNYQAGQQEALIDYLDSFLALPENIANLPKNIGTITKHPQEFLKQLENSILESFQEDFINGDLNSRARYIGEMRAEANITIAEVFLGSKGVGKINQLLKRTGEVEKYTPVNPGPLPEKVATTFRSATYTRTVTQQETTLYRVYGGKAGELGPYWSRTKPQGPLQTVIDSALDQNWGNNATKLVEIRVPKGVEIFEGTAAPQRGLVGGGNQVYIERVDPSWIVK